MAFQDEDYVKLSLEAVRDYLLKHDGRVKQSDLINHFRGELTNVVTKARARQDFKDILQLITAAKTENGEKYILLTKNNQEHAHKTSIIHRKAQRPLSARKDLCKSKNEIIAEHLQKPFASETAYTHHHPLFDSAPNSPVPERRKISSGSNSSGEGKNVPASVSKLRDALENRVTSMAESVCSLESCEDLEEDVGLNEEIHPEEKSWMMASSSGQLQVLKELYDVHPYLLNNKDFILGYTALHWAAKLGRTDIAEYITSKGIEIDSKSHSGSTPLHVAAMSGKDSVILLLIQLGANIHSRDYSGKKPRDIVKGTVSDTLQRKLGRSLVIDTNTVLQTGVISTIQMQRNKKSRRSFSHVSDGENSPMDTPESIRKHLKSVSGAQRSKSFLGGKKKKRPESRLTADDILHSPLMNLPRPMVEVVNSSTDEPSPGVDSNGRPESGSYVGNTFSFDV